MHLIDLLLGRGHRVRGTLRRMDAAQSLIAVLGRDRPLGERLEFVPAQLERDDGWAAAVEGLDGVFHVASPVPRKIPIRDDGMVGSARDGTIRVLEAARRARIPRVVMTSSIAAIGGGHPQREAPFTELDWSVVEPLPPYNKSKTVAELAAWDYVQAHPDAPELVTINPSFVLGPLLWAERSPSLELVAMLLSGKVPLVPDLYFGLVDVRDVAKAHYLAMVAPDAAGKRFICNNVTWSYLQIAKSLHDYLAPRGIRVPTTRLPSWTIRMGALVSLTLREEVAPRLGRKRDFDSSRLRQLLGWEPRGIEETLQETADSLLAFGLSDLAQRRPRS